LQRVGQQLEADARARPDSQTRPWSGDGGSGRIDDPAHHLHISFGLAVIDQSTTDSHEAGLTPKLGRVDEHARRGVIEHIDV
jgi:hypothetical protein